MEAHSFSTDSMPVSGCSKMLKNADLKMLTNKAAGEDGDLPFQWRLAYWNLVRYFSA